MSKKAVAPVSGTVATATARRQLPADGHPAIATPSASSDAPTQSPKVGG